MPATRTIPAGQLQVGDHLTTYDADVEDLQPAARMTKVHVITEEGNFLFPINKPIEVTR